MAVLLVESLDSGRVVDESDYYIAVSGSIGNLHKDAVAAEYTDIDHGVPLYLEDESLLVWYKLNGEREVALDILLGKDGHAGCNLTYNRYTGHLLADHTERVINDLNGTGFGWVTFYISALFQSLQMSVDR